MLFTIFSILILSWVVYVFWIVKNHIPEHVLPPEEEKALDDYYKSHFF